MKSLRWFSAVLGILVLLASAFATAEGPAMTIGVKVSETVVVVEGQPQNAAAEGTGAQEAPPTPHGLEQPAADGGPIGQELTESVSEPTCAPTETEPAPEAGLESTPEPTFGPTAEPVAEESTGPALACAIRWVFGAGEGLPGWGEAITLQAEIDPVAEGARLQWQIAPKPADQLKENEEEWVDAPGECGLRYTFTLAEGMQAWRWRLRVIPAAGEPVYSDEVALPPVAVDEEDDLADGPGALPAEDVLGAQEATALPMANIRFTAGVPDEEITIGTEIVLLAEIENAREGMVLQWQYAVDGGAEPAWEDIAGANEAAYAYVLDEENAQWLWRLLITVPEPAEEEPGDEAISVAEESPADEGTQATEASGGLEAEAIAAETLPQ